MSSFPSLFKHELGSAREKKKAADLLVTLTELSVDEEFADDFEELRGGARGDEICSMARVGACSRER